MNNTDLQHFREKLIQEKTLLESELASVGKVNPENSIDWKATSGSIETDSADENEVADKFEELEENEIIIDKLEPQYIDVISALERIEKGVYGMCELCSKPIEKERLEANASSKKCMEHMMVK